MMEASKNRQAIALQLLEGVVPTNRQAALAAIEKAYSNTDIGERSEKFYLTDEAARLSWAELSPDQVNHVLMTLVHQYCGDFRTACSIVLGQETNTAYLDLDV